MMTMMVAASASYPLSSDMLSMALMAPVEPPLEPLPLDDLSPLELPPSSPQHPGAYRRRCTAALAMLVASCGSESATFGEEDEDELRCRYPSKRCRNTRVRKASGALHRYCAHHRDKANANQKRWVGRQRSGAGSGSPTAKSSASSSPSSSAASSPTSAKRGWMASASLSGPSANAATLSDDEWDSLLSLLAKPAAAPIKTQSPTTPRSRRQRSVAGPGRRRWTPLV